MANGLANSKIKKENDILAATRKTFGKLEVKRTTAAKPD